MIAHVPLGAIAHPEFLLTHSEDYLHGELKRIRQHPAIGDRDVEMEIRNALHAAVAEIEARGAAAPPP